MGEVLDETAGTTLAAQAAWARNPWQRFRGLMLRRRLRDGQGLVIEPCSSIHMMFMLFPIDAVFYDREGKVTRVKHRVLPWIGLAFGGRGARGVIEIPAGAARGVEPGHQLRLTEAANGLPPS